MLRRRHELASAGFDDFGATLGGYATRLRVPPLTGTKPFVFLLCAADLVPGDCIVGLSQYASLAAIFNTGAQSTPPNVYLERPIVSPMWRPPDGFVRWVLTFDSIPTQPRRGPVDQDSFKFEDGSTPALLYETATIPFPALLPGYLGLSAYTPPKLKGVSKLTMRDIRFPWAENSFRAMRLPAPRTPVRARFYAIVKQTTPVGDNGRPSFPVNLATAGMVQALTAEDVFLKLFEQTAQYFAVAGRMVIDRTKLGQGGGESVGKGKG